MRRRNVLTAGLVVGLLTLLGGFGISHASADPLGNFSLQVTPSPLVATVKPGVKTQLELKVRNNGTGVEALKIEPRAFTLSRDSKTVNLLDTTPPDISSWISFSGPRFTVQPGQWFSEEVTLNVPKDAGFSYSFALVISRQSDPKPTGSGRLIQGSLAVFTLVNIDRPGATSSLKVHNFTTSKHIYEYLPATFSIDFQNDGNTIAQPYGNLFVQRSANSKTPLASMAVNATKGYILPGTTRTITASWNDGFPAYKTTTNADGTTSQKLIWNWANLSHLRIGRYTAHLVAVYDQGGHDTPLEATLTFWVIPWKLLLIPLAVLLLILFAIYMLVRSIVRGIKKRGDKRKTKADKPKDSPDSPVSTDET
jgi:hypothetical protein